MFTEMHLHMDREIRKLDLAEKMAERRTQSLAATRTSSLRDRIARMLFALAASEKQEVWSTAGKSSDARGRT